MAKMFGLFGKSSNIDVTTQQGLSCVVSHCSKNNAVINKNNCGFVHFVKITK
jgi:hypothetical protein